MTKASPFISVSNAGEFSPRMDARIDFEKYGAAISRGLNLVCLPQGGVTFRPGNRFIKESKNSASISALIPFEPSSSTSYMIEAGANYFRFYRNQGQITALTTTTAITNGTFVSDISGWTNKSTGSASISWSAGSMALVGSGNGYGWAEQQVLISGIYTSQVHVIKFTVVGSNANSLATIQIGTSSGSSNIVKLTGLGIGSHTVGFTPGGTSVFLQFINESNDTAYISNVSVLSNQPVELDSPYAAADVGNVRFAQSADVKYLYHDNYAPYKLQRRGDTSWSLVKVFFADGPWLDVNPDTDLSASNLIKNSSFAGGLANWTQAVSGNGYVNYSQNSVFFGVFATGASTGQISQAIVTGASTSLHVLHYQIVGGGQVTVSIGTSAGATDIVAVGALNAGWYSTQFTPGAGTFYVTFSSNNAAAAIAGGVSGAFCYNTKARLLQPSGLTGAITVNALGDFAPFASTDVGRMIRFEYVGREPAWGIITGYTSPSSVSLTLYRDVPTGAPCESWRLGAWSNTTGWPHVGAFYQQRLLAAHTALQPQTLWGSQSGDFENMRPDAFVQGAVTVQDTNALNFTLASLTTSPILWLIGSRRLVVGTAAGQLACSSKGAAITPSDFSADPQTSIRSYDAPPVQIDTAGIYIERAQRQLYDIGYSFQVDSFKAADISILSDHITKGNLAQIVYQSQPFSIVWGRLATGTLTCLTYKRDQNVVGWTPVTIAGSLAGAAVVESIATIPGASDPGQVYTSINRDELWMIVNRTINGSTKRYIEMMEGFFDGPNRATYFNKTTWRADVLTAQADAFHVDAGLTYKGVSTSTISGLSHLEGETVSVLADGAAQSSKTVSGGQITLDLAASTVHVGFGYGWVFRGMKYPYGSPDGPSVGDTKTFGNICFVLRDAASFDYAIDQAGEGDDESGDLQFSPVPFRSPSYGMSQGSPLFSGEVQIDAPVSNGFNTDPRIVMQGTAPLPWTLLGINPTVSESDL